MEPRMGTGLAARVSGSGRGQIVMEVWVDRWDWWLVSVKHERIMAH